MAYMDFFGACLLGQGARMTSRFHLIPGNQGGNVAAFSVLLLFSLSGLMLQGGIMVACCGALLLWNRQRRFCWLRLPLLQKILQRNLV